MNEPVTLDDDFAFREINSVATISEALIPPVGSRREAKARREAAVEGCYRQFDRHRGFSGQESALHPEQRLLRRGLDVIGLLLGLESALPMFERIIEVDWRAHVDLDKEKRYRDHIIHPIRVTAIGTWLLHREDHALLADMATYYERATRSYRALRGIDPGPHSWEDLVRYAWLAAGLLHDSAYPLEYHLRAAKRLGDSLCDALGMCASPAGLRSPAIRSTLVSPLAGSWFTAQRIGLEARLAALPGRDYKHAHALLGALNHLHKLGDVLHSLQGLVLQMAARAIVTHHDKEQAAIVADPLAFLLYVADNLQAWKRPFLFAQTLPDRPGEHTIRPLVECDRIELLPSGEGYHARFCMNPDPRDMEILKEEPYRWSFEAFRQPNQALQQLIERHGKLPPIQLSEPTCIWPEEFRAFMESQ